MTTGFLGSANLAAATDTLIYTMVTNQSVNIRFANRNASLVKIRVAIGTGASPALTDYIDYDVTVIANGILEDTGLVCSIGEKIWVRSDTANVSVRAHGM